MMIILYLRGYGLGMMLKRSVGDGVVTSLHMETLIRSKKWQ
jgi:hypothetical protein